MVKPSTSYFTPMSEAEFAPHRDLLARDEQGVVTFEACVATASARRRYCPSREGWQQQRLVREAAERSIPGLDFVGQPMTYLPPRRISTTLRSLRRLAHAVLGVPIQSWPPGIGALSTFDNETPEAWEHFLVCLGEALEEALDRKTGLLYVYGREG